MPIAFYEMCLSSFVVIVFNLYIWTQRRVSLREPAADVPGPASESLLIGNLGELLHAEVGTCDSDWISRFGPVVCIKGCFGEKQFFIADPKALQHIHGKKSYLYEKPVEQLFAMIDLLGHGLLSVTGETHKRHRKATQPAFGSLQIKNLAPIFAKSATKMVQKWRDILAEEETRSSVLNIPAWTARASLDAIGEAGFGYDFGALDEMDNNLAKGYQNFLLDLFAKPSVFATLLAASTRKLPAWIIRFLLHLPSKAHLRRSQLTVAFSETAQELLRSKTVSAQGEGGGGRDVMSILVTAHVNGQEFGGLSTDEMISQMRTLLIAGHETVGGTMSWALLRLAQNPHVQSKLRSEVRAMLAASSKAELSESDVNEMPYLQAFIKEVLRLDPLIFYVFRAAISDDVLPLSEPLTLLSGKTVTELPIKKGQRFISSVHAYNRYKPVWGPDADVFDPERWLCFREGPEVRLGIYGNMLTFLEGPRNCIGWRFAILELQIYIAEIVGSFQISLPENAKRICRLPSVVMAPVVEGEFEKGVQLPLRLTLLD